MTTFTKSGTIYFRLIVSVTRWNKENVEDRFEFGGDEGEVEDDDESKSDLGVIVVLILVGEDVGVGGTDF